MGNNCNLDACFTFPPNRVSVQMDKKFFKMGSVSHSQLSRGFMWPLGWHMICFCYVKLARVLILGGKKSVAIVFFFLCVCGSRAQSPLHQMLIITLSEIQTDLKSNQNENIFQLLLNESNGTFAESFWSWIHERILRIKIFLIAIFFLWSYLKS